MELISKMNKGTINTAVAVTKNNEDSDFQGEEQPCCSNSLKKAIASFTNKSLTSEFSEELPRTCNFMREIYVVTDNLIQAIVNDDILATQKFKLILDGLLVATKLNMDEVFASLDVPPIFARELISKMEYLLQMLNPLNPYCAKPALRALFMQELIRHMPKSIQDTIIELKNLHLEYLEMEKVFFTEVNEVELKFQAEYEPILQEQHAIIHGEKEVSANETQIKLNDQKENEQHGEDVESGAIDKVIESSCAEDDQAKLNIKGIPSFWLVVLKSMKYFKKIIKKRDEDALLYLHNIRTVLNKDLSITYEFHFDPNKYFHNRVLTKKYYTRIDIKSEESFLFEGPEIYKCEGCNISWKKPDNLVSKTVRGMRKFKKNGCACGCRLEIFRKSFFNYFDPPQEKIEELQPKIARKLAADFKSGLDLRNLILRRPVLYFTGEKSEYEPSVLSLSQTLVNVHCELTEDEETDEESNASDETVIS